MARYNYAVFDRPTEQAPFEAFDGGLHAGDRAPSFPLEELSDGAQAQAADLWRGTVALLEFGSFT